jgi:pimeloyl-ACP methyl ester carboxylesterase
VFATSIGLAQTEPVSTTHQQIVMTQVSMSPASSGRSADQEAIRPFHVHFSDADLNDMRRRIQATRFPDRETVTDQSQGVPLATVKALARYWATEYDWRKCEAMLNSVPQFMTTIDGLDIHFIHVRSKHKNALPLLASHGWPGSILEQMKLIGPLTDPTAYGGKAEDAFDVVIPSMPGFGFSGKPTTAGWEPARIGRAWITLMKRLGYERFVATGGDWGGLVVDLMAIQGAPELAGIHTNFPGAVPPAIEAAAVAGAPMPPGLSAEEQRAYVSLAYVYQHVYYAYYMASRPQTLTALADSPVGLATFLLDHDGKSLALISRVFDGKSEGLTRDDILDNITLFWLTNTALSAARIYWENKHAFFSAKGVTIPVAVSVFPDELYQAPRSWAEKAYPKLVYYNQLARGGHFAAWEQPELLTHELRAGFRSLRSPYSTNAIR